MCRLSCRMIPVQVFSISRVRRIARSSRRLRGCRERLLTQNALWGSGTARHLGPTPRGRLKFGCEHVCRTRTARNRRVKDARRSVTGPPSAVLARSLPVAHFGLRGRKPRFLNRKLADPDVPFSGHICYIPPPKIDHSRRARKLIENFPFPPDFTPRDATLQRTTF